MTSGLKEVSLLHGTWGYVLRTHDPKTAGEGFYHSRCFESKFMAASDKKYLFKMNGRINEECQDGSLLQKMGALDAMILTDAPKLSNINHICHHKQILCQDSFPGLQRSSCSIEHLMEVIPLTDRA